MPFQKRLVAPVSVCRGALPQDATLPSELEALTNGTLSSVVRQLSSLSRHAEDMFGELFREAERIVHRSNGLQLRIDSLADRVTRLDSTVEEVSLQDIHMRKAFRSRVANDQEVFSRESMPAAMRQLYLSCEAPPPLHKLNQFRDDGKDGMQFYTDPNYFFELWRQEMLRENDRLMHEKGKKPHRLRHQDGSGGRHKNRVRQAHNTRQKHVQMALEHGEYISGQMGKANGTPPQHTPQPGSGMVSPVGSAGSGSGGTSSAARRDSVDVQRGLLSPDGSSDASAAGDTSLYSSGGGGGDLSRVVSTRPSQPPPAPPALEPGPPRGRLQSGREALPPPPPPPPPTATAPGPPPPPPPENGEYPPPMPLQAAPELPEQPPPPLPLPALPEDLPPPPPVPVPELLLPPSPPLAPPPPPPPPPLELEQAIYNGQHSPISADGDPNNIITNMELCSSPPRCGPTEADGGTAAVLTPPPTTQPQPPCVARSDLLKAIRTGISLRKVEVVEERRLLEARPLHDVASILARRVAIEVSDSASGSESDTDSDGWNDESSV